MKRILLLTAAASLLLFFACKGNTGDSDTSDYPSAPSTDYTKVAIPEFSADSAYAYVEKQLSFGNRIPGSKGWERCAEWLTAQMSRFCDTVIVQDFRAVLWAGSAVPGKNIIAQLNPQAERRILLAAHWDSRLWADHDSDESRHHSPIDGANDGASGVGVILELARVMSQMPPDVGIDFILFDTEDQGTPDWAEQRDNDSWCKGSQYWAQHPHQPCYTALYGILFDMVGTPNPRFTQEEISRQFAPTTLNKVWTVAQSLGYGKVFLNQKTDPILDDHFYINQLARIPTIDIVQNSVGHSFFPYWHTTADNLDAIDSSTLKMVGDVTLKTVYADYGKR